MTTPEGEVFVDANVFLSATDDTRPNSARSLAILDDWPVTATLVTSGQVLREYWAVSTRPRHVNGLGLLPEEASANLDAFGGRVVVLDDGAEHYRTWLALVRRLNVTGAAAHDVAILATMQINSVRQIATFDAGVFRRSAEEGRIAIVV